MPQKAIDLFKEVRSPNEIILTLLFTACARVNTSEALDLVKKAALQMPQSSYSDVFLVTSLLNALMKCGDVVTAHSLFDATPSKVVSMYGAMMKGRHSCFNSEIAACLFLSRRLHRQCYARKSHGTLQTSEEAE